MMGRFHKITLLMVPIIFTDDGFCLCDYFHMAPILYPPIPFISHEQSHRMLFMRERERERQGQGREDHKRKEEEKSLDILDWFMGAPLRACGFSIPKFHHFGNGNGK